MHQCKNCGTRWYGTITKEQRPAIRAFKEKYQFVSQTDIAGILGIGDARMSEIINSDVKRSGL
jgi:hypothetical protein